MTVHYDQGRDGASSADRSSAWARDKGALSVREMHRPRESMSVTTTNSVRDVKWRRDQRLQRARSPRGVGAWGIAGKVRFAAFNAPYAASSSNARSTRATQACTAGNSPKSKPPSCATRV